MSGVVNEVTFIAAGSGTSLAIGYPAETVFNPGGAGDMLILLAGFGNDPMTIPATPSGWTPIAKLGGGVLGFTGGDTAAYGAGVGPRGLVGWYRTSDGTEISTAATVTISNAFGASATRTLRVAMHRIPKDALTWDAPTCAVAEDTFSTSLDIAPAIFVTGRDEDLLLGAGAWTPGATATSGGISGALRWSTGAIGATTQRSTGAAANGNSVRVNTYSAPVTGTINSAAPSLILPFASNVAGVGALIRLRATGAALVALAGNDETSIEPLTDIVLDGSASTGAITAWTWTKGGVAVPGTGPVRRIEATPTLAGYADTYTLTVTDGTAVSPADTVIKTVLPTSRRYVMPDGSITWAVEVSPGNSAYDPARSYTAGDRVSFGGRSWVANAAVPRFLAPAGVGDGSIADRDLLMAQRRGHAATVTGGYAGATYVVTTLADTGAGSLRAGLESPDPLWIVFDKTVCPPGVLKTINAGGIIYPLPNKTVDGRGSRVKLLTGGGIVIQGIGNPTNASTTFVRFAGGVANMIFSHLEIKTTVQYSTNRDCFTLAYGYDLVWLNQVGPLVAPDGAIDMTEPDDGGINNLYGTGASNTAKSRVTVTWASIGPMPSADYLVDYPVTGGDNRPENGKASLIGLHDDTYNKLFVTFDRVWWHGATQRSPKIAYGANVHMNNCYVDRWAAAPPLVVDQAQADYYTSIGKTSIINTFGSVATDVQYDARARIDSCAYRPYTVDEPHLIDATWPVRYPDNEALFIKPSTFTTSGGGVVTSGLQLLGDAFRAADYQPANVPAVPYTPLNKVTADATMISEIEIGAANYQPWSLA